MKAFCQSNGNRRVGDEIATTAVWKYYRKFKYPAEIPIYYYDTNKFGIPSTELFPKNLVQFVDKPTFDIGRKHWQWLDEHNLWIMSPFLRYKQIYSELAHRQSINPKYDVVFCPLIAPDYDVARGMSPRFTVSLIDSIYKIWPNSYIILDANKIQIKNAHPNIILSKSFAETFEYIRESKIYIGGNTGTSHYAGGIDHKSMILLYDTNEKNKIVFQKQRIQMSLILEEPELLNSDFDYNCEPNCNRKNYTLYILDDHQFDIPTILKKIEELTNGLQTADKA